MPKKRNPLISGVVALRSAVERLETPVRQMRRIAGKSTFASSGTQKELDAVLLAAKRVHHAIKLAVAHADGLWREANRTASVRMHALALSVADSAEAVKDRNLAAAEVASDAVNQFANSMDHSRENLTALLHQVFARSKLGADKQAPRPDEWIKALVSDQIPWSASIQLGLNAAFGVDLDKLVWNHLAEEGRRSYAMRVHHASLLEIELAMTYCEQALSIAGLALKTDEAYPAEA
ncbi:MAG: hypothetical protein JNM79_22130 [Burkholderiales bacterium]|nr:hypothetical protein [Burkholderiales bacterium]